MKEKVEQEHRHSGKSSESFLDKSIILKSLPISSGQSILDAGCGSGYMAKEFSKLVGSAGRVYAVDIYEESINRLRSKSEGSNIIAALGDVTKRMPIEDSSIDLVYLSNVFHGFSIPQRRNFLQELKRILKAGGILAVVEMNKGNTPFGPPASMKYSPEELIVAVGLESRELTKIGDYFYMQTFVYES